MKVLVENPGLTITCRGCCSVYVIGVEDVTEVRPPKPVGFWQKFHWSFRAFDPAYEGVVATWSCPVCDYQERMQIHKLPTTWLTFRKDAQ